MSGDHSRPSTRREIDILSNNSGTVYLVHLDKPMAHARHYIGFSSALEKRLDNHLKGTGSRFLAGANRAGIGYSVVRTWENVDRNFERRLKKWHKSRLLCPCCMDKPRSPTP